ncbi:FkbM family methyltransferase [Arcobacter sp. CECT 8985]|uniref:FkbM family methyltransferase n=1 Tax=Arcobacter sp. CECT 8985 TaxID=1935424 RepID=UPI00100AF793|nr:FkbM family methyltransferase [Arcobacter sp. CECT 8985]RXJ85292.1 hypothetical protein CRU93_11410 [Arcobacter sp. CECT 8985]
MKNILIYSPVPIFPAIQGNRKRIFNMIQSLKNEYNLFLIIYGNVQQIENEKDFYNDAFKATFIYPQGINHSFLFNRNINIDDAYENGLGEYVSEICNTHNIDIYLHNYIFQSKVLEFVPNSILKIIDTHDKFKDKYKLAKWYSYSEEEESKGVSRADVILAIQDEEKKYFESITSKKVITVGHLSESNFLNKEYNDLKNIGIISSGHIRDFLAVEKFVQQFIKNDIKGVTLNIAGMVCEKLEPLYNHPNINYLWLVDDLKDFYKSIELCIIPPEDGTGLKIKSVEALSYGVPIISTKHGFVGIETNDYFHQAKNVDELMNYIIEIQKNSILNALQIKSKTVFNKYQKLQKNNLKIAFNHVKNKGLTEILEQLKQNGYNSFLNSDELTRKIMKLMLNRGEEAIDIGVNYGQFLFYLSNLVGVDGKVLGFEPIKELFELNLAKIEEQKMTNILLHNFALSNSEGISEFTVFNERKGYSGLKENVILDSSFDVNNKSKIEVIVKKLDIFLSDFKKLKLIKIDVEGAELLVLKGAEELLLKFRPIIIFEFGMRTAKSFNYDQQDIYNFFIERNYSIYIMSGLKLNSFEDFLLADSFIYNFIAIHNEQKDSIDILNQYSNSYLEQINIDKNLSCIQSLKSNKIFVYNNNKQYSKLINILEKLSSISFFKSPIKKFQAYKSLMRIYQELK